jgi:hypothetical protein
VNRSLSGAKATLARRLDEQTVRERASENQCKAKTQSQGTKIDELERVIETLKRDNEDERASATKCDERVAEKEGALRAELIRSGHLKTNLDSARAAEHNQKSALGKCEQALERALIEAAQSDVSEEARRLSQSASAAAADDDEDDRFDDWDPREDLITDIVHPIDRYDRVPREGTSHHLAGDADEMLGLEDDAEEDIERREEDRENETLIDGTPEDLSPEEPEPPKRTEKPAARKPEPWKSSPPPSSRGGRRRPMPTGKERPATASELRRKRKDARSSLFASAEM